MGGIHGRVLHIPCNLGGVLGFGILVVGLVVGGLIPIFGWLS